MALGAFAVLVVVADLGLLLLHASLRGPVSHTVERLSWIAVRRLARASRRHGVLGFAGPAAVAADLAAWGPGPHPDQLLEPVRSSYGFMGLPVESSRGLP